MNINKKILLGSTAAMVALSPLAAQQAAEAASISVGANATINSAITLTEARTLNFGILTQVAASAGTVNINFAGTVANTAGSLQPAGGSPTSAKVKVGAVTGVNLVITAGAGPFVLKTGGGGASNKSMTITGINFSMNSATGAPLTVTALANPTFLLVGANLQATSGQLSGVYTGNISLSVVYE